MSTSFAVTWDYRCPFARIGHLHVIEGLRAGALGFSTSRILGHRAVRGEPVPGTFAADDEVLALAGALKRDEDDRVANRDLFVQAEWQLAPDWSASGGLRRSRVAFDVRDFYIIGTNPDDSGSAVYTRTTPVLGLLHRLSPRWNVYANYGGGFETPTFAELSYRPGGLSGLNFALRPAVSRHREIGLNASRTIPAPRGSGPSPTRQRADSHLLV